MVLGLQLLIQKIQRSRGDTISKEELILCLIQLVQNNANEEHETSTWAKEITFCVPEIVYCQNLQRSKSYLCIPVLNQIGQTLQ